MKDEAEDDGAEDRRICNVSSRERLQQLQHETVLKLVRPKSRPPNAALHLQPGFAWLRNGT